MAKISKPDANPIVAALLTAFLFASGHYLINGQKKKWIMVLVVTFLSCCFSPIMAIMSIIDSYQTAEKLKAGKEIDENEYSFKYLYMVMKYVHKEAILVES